MKTIDLTGLTFEQAVPVIEKTIGESLTRSKKVELASLAEERGGTLKGVLLSTEKMTIADFLLEILKEEGEDDEAPYNGVFGDSCSCSACNVRRGTVGYDRTMDMGSKMSPAESIRAVIEGYGGKNNVPKEAGIELVNQKALQELLDIIRDITAAQKALKP